MQPLRLLAGLFLSLLLCTVLGASPSEQSQRLPLVFEQHPEGFLARGRGYSIHLEASQATIVLSGGGSVRAHLQNASPTAPGTGIDRQPGVANYLLSGDPGRRRTGVPTYGRVRFPDVYSGIDLVYYGSDGRLEFDFVVAPGASPDVIALRFEAAETAKLSANGDLILASAGGRLTLERPVIYQEIRGHRLAVDGGYQLTADNRVGFAVGEYDPAFPLVIDPIILYSTYFGAAGNEAGTTIAVDPQGNTYVAGLTTGEGFTVTPDAFQSVFGGQGPLIVPAGDAFVAKFSPSGRLLYSTYLGGDDDDALMGLKIDDAGDVYLAGFTKSSNFPVTPGAAQTLFGGLGGAIHTAGDGFVAKLSADGQTLLYATFLGGSDGDTINGLDIDSDGNAYVTGQTLSENFPVTEGVVQSINHGEGRAQILKAGDVFVTKVSPDGSSFAYSTFLGGSDDESGFGIAVGSDHSAFVTGFTRSTDFPVSADAIQDQFAGSGGQRSITLGDAFVTKINADASELTYSTYLGGSLDDIGYAIALDSLGCAYIAGSTLSAGFPVTDGAFQTEHAGSGGEVSWSAGDAFVSKLNENGDALLYSTFIGGSQDDRAFGIAVDAESRAYITGNTLSTDYPLTADALQDAHAGSGGQALTLLGDGFVTALDQAGAALEYSSYIGASVDDVGFGIFIGADNAVYVAGNTMSPDFPTTTDAVSRSFAGRQLGTFGFGTGDVVWFKIEGLPSARPSLITISSASFAVGDPVAPGSLATGFAPAVADALAVTTSTDLPIELSGVTVDVTDSEGATRRAGLHSVAANQVSYEIPQDTAFGIASVLLNTSAGEEISGSLEIAPVAPGFYTANSQGFGVAAAFFLFVPAQGPAVQDFIFDPNTRTPIALSLGVEGDQLFLLLFGTGMRGGTVATATINGVDVPVAGPVAHSVFRGLDQTNLGPIPRSLIGQGLVEIVLIVDGIPANTVTVMFE